MLLPPLFSTTLLYALTFLELLLSMRSGVSNVAERQRGGAGGRGCRDGQGRQRMLG